MYKIKNIKNLKSASFDILKIYSKDDSCFNGFGEAYITKVRQKEFKGYHCNLNSNSNLFILSGKVKFFIKLKKNIKTIILTDVSKKLLIIKKNTSYGFLAIKNSRILNIASMQKSKLKKRNT